MSYFGVFIPPSKTGLELTATQCAGSIAADSTQISNVNDARAAKHENPECPPDSPLWLIFTEKSKALDVLRHFKEARLREFPNREQAESYVQFGFESIESLKRFAKTKSSSKPVLNIGCKTTSGCSDNLLTTLSANSISSLPSSTVNLSSMIFSMPSGITGCSVVSGGSGSVVSSSSNAMNAERPPFRAPSKQELVEFRKQIEAGHYEQVKRIVWDNPRFLISSGDTPTSLKDGYRYNAMHICAQSNQALVAELILKIISDPKFTQLYAGKKSRGEICAALNENLLDYYLNMPDKGRGETPLHFAVKNGHIAVVEVLTSYPQCKSLKNTDGLYPKDIICQRVQRVSTDVYKKLELLLSEPHYVPVLRAVHNELPPHVGQPFSPNEPPVLQLKTSESDRLNIDFTISALAGPMPREQAFHFFRRWKTPPRIGSNVISPLPGSSFISPVKTPSKPHFINSKCHKSEGRRVLFSPTTPNVSVKETNGNKKSHQALSRQNEDMKYIENNNNNAFREKVFSPEHMVDTLATPIRQLRTDLFLEYRSSNFSPFADELLDRSSDFSLHVSSLNDSFRERHIKNSDIEKGLEVIGRQLARQEHLEWREYWDFLDTFVDIASNNGLIRLESYLSSRMEQTQAVPLSEKTSQIWDLSQMKHYIELIADHSKTSNAVIDCDDITQVITPYTCVEKSLQVFAKRITKTFINNVGNMVSINDTLLSELKRLKSLIASFMDDTRFLTVDFSKVHSRIAHLVASYIGHSMEISAALRYKLMEMLGQLLQLNNDRRDHLHCVSESLLAKLEQVQRIQLPDALNTEEMCSTAWKIEVDCSCDWDANFIRKTSRRKRTESLRAHAQDIGNTQAPTASEKSLRSAVDDATVYPIDKTIANGQSKHDIDSDDDIYFHECGFGDSSDDEDIYLTPPESRSPRLSCAFEPRYDLYIFGKEPTKRDLDVLNAIVHVQIEKVALPLVHAWRKAMESFSSAEMDLFPSPKSGQKAHKSSSIFTNKSTTKTSYGIDAVNNKTSVSDSILLANPKRLFASPKLTAVAQCHHSIKPLHSQQQEFVLEKSTPLLDTKPLAMPTVDIASVAKSFQTPFNKVRVVSKFHERRYNSSLHSFSSDITKTGSKQSLFMGEGDY